MGNELGLESWAGFGEVEGEEKAFQTRGKHAQKLKGSNSHRHLEAEQSVWPLRKACTLGTG